MAGKAPGFSQNKFFFTAERKFLAPPSWDESWQPMACAQKLVEELAKQFPHRNLVPDGVCKSIGERLSHARGRWEDEGLVPMMWRRYVPGLSILGCWQEQ